MDANAALKAGRPGDALTLLMQEVRANPADAARRTFLFQLCAVLGQWDRANTQLDVLESMDAESMVAAQLFKKIISAEAERQAVFEGRQAPTFFGEPPAWAGLLIQAVQFIAAGKLSAASNLRGEALEAAPAIPGTVNGESFEWIGDADLRLGPIIEVLLDGKYYWAPLTRIETIEVQAPSKLSDLVWTPASFTWMTGGQSSGFIPTRYPGTAPSQDEALMMSRRTDWTPEADGYSFGTGQRILATDIGDYPLLEIRKVELKNQGI